MALADEVEFDLSELDCWEAHDAVGHKYRLQVAPFYKRWVSRIRRRWSCREDEANKKKAASKDS